MERDIYHRQHLIKGWEQERLTGASVAVIGSDWLAGYCALLLGCLGVGRIYLLDNFRVEESERYLFPLRPGDSRSQIWTDWLTGLGFPNRIIGRCTNPVYGHHILLPPVDLILSATNDPGAQEALAYYSAEQSIPLVSGAANRHEGVFAVFASQARADLRLPLLPLSSGEARQGAITGAIIAALMVGEVRRLLMPLPGDCKSPSGGQLRYDMFDPRRFVSNGGQSPRYDIKQPREQSRDKRVLLVGAGALGTFAALGLATRSDVGSVTIVDPDYIEATNLNRQPLYFGAIGSGKAITLAKQLKKIQPETCFDFIDEPIAPEHLEWSRPDLVISCVDSFAPRKLLNDECARQSIPLINGGTSAFSGHLEVYHPGKTACLNCLYALDDLAEREEKEHADPEHCQRVTEGSIAVTNALIGLLMAAEAGRSLRSELWGEPLKSMLRYNAHSSRQIIVGFARHACHCGIRAYL